MAATDESFRTYRKKFPARPPNTAAIRLADETRPLTEAEGLRELAAPPCTDVLLGSPKDPPNEAAATKYLWVVGQNRVPFALDLSPGFERGRLSHTNLTGGADAHCGGEVWFSAPSTIIINGGSGRYPPRTPDELDEVARAFKATGYKVAHMGWDAETNTPARKFRGDLQWL